MAQPSLSGNPDQLPTDRGTVQRMNEALLTPQMRHVIFQRELRPSDIADWPTKPWKAYEFLASRVSPIEDSIATNPKVSEPWGKLFLQGISGDRDVLRLAQDQLNKLIGGDVLEILHDWALEDIKSASAREAWEQANPGKVNTAKVAVGSLHEALGERLKTFERTQDSLRVTKDLNSVENILRGTKEYVWDEFWDHPEMSAGLVILTYLAYKRIKGTRLGNIIALGGGLTVAGAFLKDKFGVQPTERFAEFAERVGLQQVADGVRTVRDTTIRGLFGPQGEGTINGFFYEKLSFDRTAERIAFDFLLTQNPKQFIEWSDAFGAWRQSPDKRLPSDVSRIVQEMSRGTHVPTFFKEMKPTERAILLSQVFDKVLLHIAEQNNEKTSAAGLAILKQKYIAGDYFDFIWNRFEADLTAEERRNFDPATIAQIKRARKEGAEFFQRFSRRVRKGSDEIKFMDVLYIENGDSKEIDAYEGAGLSARELKKRLDAIWEKTKDLAGVVGEKATEIGEGVKWYLTEEVPRFWRDEGLPALKDAAIKTGDATFSLLWEDINRNPGPAKKAYEWLILPQDEYEIEEPDPLNPGATRKRKLNRLEYWGVKAKEGGIFIFGKGTPIYELFVAIGLNAKDAIVLTLKETEELAKWLKEQTTLNSVLNTFAVEKNADGDLVWSLGNATTPLLIGYRHNVSIRLIPEDNPNIIGTMPELPPVIIPTYSYTPVQGDAYFKDFPLLGRSAFPPLASGYLYRRAEIELEIQNPLGTISRKGSIRQVSLQ